MAAASSGGQSHPPAALWPVALRGELRAALLVGERKIDRWTARFGCADAAWQATPYDPFFNANAPEDLAEAEKILQSIGPEAIS
jgi:molybdopterin-guanine dinucleotide biosynthesis protein A